MAEVAEYFVRTIEEAMLELKRFTSRVLEHSHIFGLEDNMEKLLIKRNTPLESMFAPFHMMSDLYTINDLNEEEDEEILAVRKQNKSQVRESKQCKCQTARKAATDHRGKEEKKKYRGRLWARDQKVRETYFELIMKNKDLQLEKAIEEIANCKQRIEEVESAKEEILRDATHEAEFLGNTVEKLQGILKEKQELIHQLEHELCQEKEKTTALEEDYESVIRALRHQLEGEKALNQSLCSQSYCNVASLQGQVQKQLEANMELSQQLEGKNAELRGLHDELDNCKKQLQSAEEKVQIASAQLIAANAEVSTLKVDKEVLQTTLSDSQGANAQSTRNSAASMFALQTAHTHLEKKYLRVKKEMDELWRERNKLKKIIATFQGNVPSEDLRLQLKELRARNEELSIRLNMGEEVFKAKFVECHRLQAQLNKVTMNSSLQSPEASSAPEMQSIVTKLQKALDEERKALDREKNSVLQKNDQINQLNLEISMLREKVSGSECLELRKTEQDKQSQTVGELLQNLSVLKNILEEKLEKENVINEIINPQDDLRNKDEELQNAAENLESTQQTLSKEQAERELLGEQARTKILEREANKKKLYVELPAEQPQPAVEQTPTQVGGPSPGLWSCPSSPDCRYVPLPRLWSGPSPPAPVPGTPQPWVFVQHQPEPTPPGVPTQVPPQASLSPVQPPQPSAPAPNAPALSVPTPSFLALESEIP